MELKIKKETAKEIYAESPNYLKKILEETFGKDCFKKKSSDKILTFEDACEVLDIDPNSVISDQDTSDEAAYKKLKVIVKSINQGWIPDWIDTNQKKWFPYFNLSSGFGFSGTDYDYAYAHASVGSLLCFESEAKAKHAGTRFLQLYKEYLTVTE